MKRDHNGQNFKTLVGLTAGVFLVHIALLSSAPASLGLSAPPPAKPFVTRTVVASSRALEPRNTAKQAPLAKASPKASVRQRPRTTASADAVAAPSAPTQAPDIPAIETETLPPAPVLAASAPTAPQEAQAPEAAAPEVVAQVTAPPAAERASTMKTGDVRLPGSALVKYKVEANKFPFNANGELLWQQDGQAYKARLSFSAFGQTRMQTSEGQITPEGLAPVRFADKYRSEVAAHFNRAQGLVTFSANTPNVALLAGAQDRLSVILQLAAVIAGNPGQFAPATTLGVQVVSARDADTWLFTVGEEETLSLAGGEQRALKLVRNPRLAFDQKVELWLSTQLDYLPVRLKITEANGDFIDQKWLSIEAPP